MEPMEDATSDRKLNDLLREWRVCDAPPSLDEGVLKLARSRWSFLLTGSIRVPVPMGLAIAAILLAMAVALVRQRAVWPQAPASVPSVSLADFRPVGDVHVRVIHSDETN